MDVSRYQWQPKRNLHQQETANCRQVIQVDSWRYQQVCQVSVRRAVAKLHEFDAELKTAIAERQADIQQTVRRVQKYVDELQVFAKETSVEYSSRGVVVPSDSAPPLDQCVDKLEASVAEYLNGLAKKDQKATVQNWEQHQSNRPETDDEAQASRDGYVAHKQDKQAFGKTLRQSVWGDVPEWKGNIAAASSLENAKTLPHKHQSPTQAELTPQSAQKLNASELDRPATTSSVSSTPSSVPEQVVYGYLQTHSKGARLAEIESSLGISRFETVDALRSLIRKELIIQDNKTYHLYKGSVR